MPNWGTPDVAEQASLFPTVPPRRIGWVGGWHRLPLVRNAVAFSIVSG